MEKKWRALVIATGGALLSSGVHAQPRWSNQWHIIGYKVVNRGSDTDSIYTPGRQRIRQLRLCAFNAPLRLRDFDVYFNNGRKQDVNTRERVAPGTCTRAIDLQGNARDVTRITLRYERIQRGFRAPIVRVSAR